MCVYQSGSFLCAERIRSVELICSWSGMSPGTGSLSVSLRGNLRSLASFSFPTLSVSFMDDVGCASRCLKLNQKFLSHQCQSVSSIPCPYSVRLDRSRRWSFAHRHVWSYALNVEADAGQGKRKSKKKAPGECKGKISSISKPQQQQLGNPRIKDSNIEQESPGFQALLPLKTRFDAISVDLKTREPPVDHGFESRSDVDSAQWTEADAISREQNNTSGQCESDLRSRPLKVRDSNLTSSRRVSSSASVTKREIGKEGTGVHSGVEIEVTNLASDVTRGEYESIMRQVPGIVSWTYVASTSGLCSGTAFCTVHEKSILPQAIEFLSKLVVHGQHLKAFGKTSSQRAKAVTPVGRTNSMKEYGAHAIWNASDFLLDKNTLASSADLSGAGEEMFITQHSQEPQSLTGEQIMKALLRTPIITKSKGRRKSRDYTVIPGKREGIGAQVDISPDELSTLIISTDWGMTIQCLVRELEELKRSAFY